jgi:hypothetical protein
VDNGYILAIDIMTLYTIGGIIMNTNTNTTTEKVYTINGQIVTEAMYRAWLDERRGGSGF